MKWFLLLVLTLAVFGQTPPAGSTGPTLPTPCFPGQLWNKTGTAAGVYMCNSSGTWVLQTSVPGAVVNWGQISGTLTNQADLVSALASKAALSHVHLVADVTGLQGFLDAKASVASPTFTGVFDLSGLTRTRPWKYGTTAPGTCTLGDAFFDSDAMAGENILICTSTDVWTPIRGSGSGAGNYSLAFTGQTSITLAHNFNSTAVLVECENSSKRRVEPDSVDYTDPNSAIVTFFASQTGTCKANAGGSGGSGGGADMTTVTNSGAGAKVLKTGTNVTARTIVAGANVTVTENTDTIEIASSGGGGGGTTYTAGSGLTLTGTVFSVNGAVIPSTQCQVVTPAAWSSIGTKGYQTQTVAAIGFLDTDAVYIGTHNTLAAGLFPFVRGLNDSVEITLINMTAGSLTPATLPFRVCYTRHF